MLSKTLVSLYGYNQKWSRALLLKAINRLEGGEIYSKTLREIFRKYYEVDIGLYSYGGCFVPGKFDKKTTIGNYVSIAEAVRVMNRNHPLNFRSTHPFFFNPVLKQCSNEIIEYQPLTINHDVWIGHSALIMPSVTSIGTGAVVAAGAIVNKNIPPYAIVVGHPARIVRYRFSEQIIEELLASKWWEKSIEEIKPDILEFCRPYESDQLNFENIAER